MAQGIKNKEVIRAWTEGYTAWSHTGNLHTQNGKLYSYSQLIGRTTKDGTKVLFDFTAPAKAFKSVTTSIHVGIARPHADVIINGRAAIKSGISEESCAYDDIQIPF